MDSKQSGRNFNRILLLAYDTGGAQDSTARIDVPFSVKRIIFHPPYVQVLAADAKSES